MSVDDVLTCLRVVNSQTSSDMLIIKHVVTDFINRTRHLSSRYASTPQVKTQLYVKHTERLKNVHTALHTSAFILDYVYLSLFVNDEEGGSV